MFLENVQVSALADAITVYWDKPYTQEQNLFYEVFLDGKSVKTVDRTHVTLENLQENQNYQMMIQPLPKGLIEPLKLDVATSKRKRRIDVTAAPYFAKGDGVTLNTKKLQQAFDDCTAEEVVYFPAGVYMTGALDMHSDMELYLDENAVLQGTDEVKDYLPMRKSRFEGIENESYSSLLNLGKMNYKGGYTCKNVVIRGKGTISGGGRRLAEKIISLEKERMKPCLEEMKKKISECENENTIPGRVRPRLINISNAQNIRITGLTIKNGPSWNVHMIYSDSIITDHCTFYSKDVWNGDGWDPDSSSNCTIFACTFYTGDDAIAIKSGKNPEGNMINKPSREIRIFDCDCAFGNGIAIGSEMSGGVCNIKIWDCDLSKSMYGLEIKGTKKRGGYVEQIEVTNCVVPRILFHEVGYNDDGVGAETPPVFKNCRFRDITITGVCLDLIHGKVRNCEAVVIQGFDQKDFYVENVVLENISILSKPGNCPGIFLKNCKNVFLENVSMEEDKKMRSEIEEVSI